ncbi:MAG: helix-turn-helix domain-containing protein [Chthoniobacteraceae bacterium]|nr:helix-turn-helix domain-containing protein [Chthoniobacteraceae bacterium]
MRCYESWEYSGSFVAGRLLFHRTFRQWEESRLDDWQVAYTFTGQGLVHCGAERLTTRTGELLLFRPHQPRRYEPVGDPVHWGHIWVHVQPDDALSVILRRLTESKGMTLLSLPTPELRKKVMADLSEMCEVGSSRAVYREQLAYKLLETALIRGLSVAHSHDQSALDPRLQRVLDLLSENLTAPFDSKALGRACGLSERQMFRLFAEHTGQSPRRYLEICRIERARYLLKETKMPVGEVATQVGFESPFYFTTRFKSHTGLSPRSYRQKMT